MVDSVCVIIAAKNAAGTIGVAIGSALREAAVHEVIVIDDGSTDHTARAAAAADDGSGRLRVITMEKNGGPAAARNHAIEVSRSPLIAILDADDFFFPRRFAPMLQEGEWDFVADNIAFTREADGKTRPQPFEPRGRRLSTLDFIEGNISQPGKKRGEIGFLKPVMRRSFLDAHGLRYDETLRLGEDYDLYLRALLKGARYTVIEHCGYGAVVRPDSLSGQHRTEDLRRLFKADQAILLEEPHLPADVATALKRHEKHIRDRYELRAFLDVKRQSGKLAAFRHVTRNLRALPAVAGGILRDKVQVLRKPVEDAAPEAGLRYLIPGVPLAQK